MEAVTSYWLQSFKFTVLSYNIDYLMKCIAKFTYSFHFYIEKDFNYSPI